MIHPNSALKTASPLSCGEQNSQLSRIRNPGSDGQTLAAEADFLPAPNWISLTDFSYFLDWFAEEHFHQQAEGSEVSRGQGIKLTLLCKSQLSCQRLHILLTWASLGKCSKMWPIWRQHKLTPAHRLQIAQTYLENIEVVKLLSIRDELFWGCIINRKWE